MMIVDIDDKVISIFYTHLWVGTGGHQVDLLFDSACLMEFLSAFCPKERKERLRKEVGLLQYSLCHCPLEAAWL